MAAFVKGGFFFRVPVSPLGNDRGQTMFLSSYVVLNSLWILCGLFLYNATVSTVHDPCRIWLPFACLWKEKKEKKRGPFVLVSSFPPLFPHPFVRSLTVAFLLCLLPPPRFLFPRGKGADNKIGAGLAWLRALETAC